MTHDDGLALLQRLILLQSRNSRRRISAALLDDLLGDFQLLRFGLLQTLGGNLARAHFAVEIEKMRVMLTRRVAERGREDVR